MGSAVRLFYEVNQRKNNFMICVPGPEELDPGRAYFGFFLSTYRVTLTIKANRKQANRSAIQATGVLCRLTGELFTVA